MTGALVPNPHASILPVGSGPGIEALVVRAPVRGRGLRTTTVRRAEAPEAFRSALGYFLTRGRGAATPVAPRDASHLQALGVLVSPEEVSRPPRLACDLDDLADPIRARSAPAARAGQDELIVNPTLEPLADADRSSLGFLAEDRAWAWLEDPDHHARALVSARGETAGLLARLTPGQSAPEVGRDVAARLRAGGVLVSPAAFAAGRGRRARAVEEAAGELALRAYAILPAVLPPILLAGLRRYYRELAAEGGLTPGDHEWPHRDFAGNEAVGRFFHRELAPLLSGLAREPVKPSFLYYAAYHGGAALAPHRDREQCEWGVSLQLDHVPEPEGPAPWPLHLEHPETGDPPAAVRLRLGELAVYRGRLLRHHRDPLTAGHTSSYWFLFYVPEAFSGPLE